MKWFWNNYAPNNSIRKEPTTISLLHASIDQLSGIAVCSCDYRRVRCTARWGRDLYAHTLMHTGVPVTATRCLGTIDYFMMLNVITDRPAYCTRSYRSNCWNAKKGVHSSITVHFHLFPTCNFHYVYLCNSQDSIPWVKSTLVCCSASISVLW